MNGIEGCLFFTMKGLEEASIPMKNKKAAVFRQKLCNLVFRHSLGLYTARCIKNLGEEDSFPPPENGRKFNLREWSSTEDTAMKAVNVVHGGDLDELCPS